MHKTNAVFSPYCTVNICSSLCTYCTIDSHSGFCRSITLHLDTFSP
nr:MAG TPA: hypothetical protein [Caudoviricetes sp.]